MSQCGSGESVQTLKWWSSKESDLMTLSLVKDTILEFDTITLFILKATKMFQSGTAEFQRHG